MTPWAAKWIACWLEPHWRSTVVAGTVSGQPAVARGINSEGLKRRGFTAEQIRNIRNAYRTVYRSGMKLAEAIHELESLVAEQPELEIFVESLKSAERGIIR